MRIIDRHIARPIITTFVSTIIIFSFLYILIDVASNLTEIIDRKVPFGILFHYYLAFFPIMIVQTSSIACLIAVLLTFANLNHNNEIIALRSSGLSFWAITKSALFFAMVVSAFIFWINERFIPQAAFASNEIRNENIILKTDSERKKKEKIINLTFYGLRNRLYFIDSFDPNTYELEGITILGQDENQNLKEKIIALKGKWTGIAWKFYDCQITSFASGDVTSPEGFHYDQEKLMDIREAPKDFLRQRIDVTSMNIRELHGYIKRFARSGATKAINSLRVDLHSKIAFPFTNFVIVLVGLPLAMMTGRRKGLTFASLGLAIGIGFFFYVINAVGLALGKGGLFSPVLAAWFAPVIFLIIALYLIKLRF